MKERIRKKSLRFGFELFGVTTPELDQEDEARLSSWLEEGRGGSMNWMRRHQKASPASLLPGARSVICLGISYHLPDTSLPPNAGRIARYARGGDYHRVIEEKLKELIRFLEKEFGAESRSYVDHGPLLEKSLARRAGLGWIGKNTTLINEKLGSFLFLAEIITTLPLEPDHPLDEKCGACGRCLEACPTGALTAPYTLDAQRCLSYLTIERKGEIPAEELPKMSGCLVGCDRCQAVCPYNLRAPMTREEKFNPINEFLDLDEVIGMSEEEFGCRFKETSIKRVGLDRLKRNARALKEGKERG